MKKMTPEILDALGKNLFMGDSPTIASQWRWEQLDPVGRQAWCDQALALVRDHEDAA
jgi:hypothetical protein